MKVKSEDIVFTTITENFAVSKKKLLFDVISTVSVEAAYNKYRVIVQSKGTATSSKEEKAKKVALTAAVKNAKIKLVKLVNEKYKETAPGLNVVQIMFDQHIAWHNLPTSLTDTLPGYQKFKKIGVEFTNIYNSRQDCSPSRSTIPSGIMNTGIQDNINNVNQYQYVPRLDPQLNTVAKVLLQNGYEKTAFVGKAHLDASLATTAFIVPAYRTKTRTSMQKYGYQVFGTFGDNTYNGSKGYMGDQIAHEFKINDLNEDVDYVTKTGEKYIGIMPFLRARAEDKKLFYLEAQYDNPHDTQESWQNISKKPSNQQNQYGSPFYKEQLVDANIPLENGPFYFDNLNADLVVTNPNFNYNFFEKTYKEYKFNTSSLPFEESYMLDYATNPTNNSPFVYNIGQAEICKTAFTMPDSKLDVKSWKNLINVYYALVTETDNYVNDIYEFLKANDMFKNTAVVITSDHGDLMSAHGLKQKGLEYQQASNVPFLVVCPGLEPGKSSVLGSLLDYAPTLLTMTNSPIPASFLGTSLLIKEPTGKFKPRKQNKSILSTFNSLMTVAGFYPYRLFYALSPNAMQQRLLNSYSFPNNVYEYFFAFNMVVTKRNGKQYKLSRWFCMEEIFAYNYIFNTAFTSQFPANNKGLALFPIITSELVEEYASQYTQEQKDAFLQFVKTSLSASGYTYGDVVLNLYKLNGKETSVDLSIFLNLANKLLQVKMGGKIMLPGTVSDFAPLYRSRGFYFKLFNLTDDPSEVTNLLDKNYPDRQTPEVLKTARILNRELNDLIETQCGTNNSFIFYISDNLFLSAAKIIESFGTDIAKYNAIQMLQIVTSFGAGDLDTTFIIQGNVAPGQDAIVI